MSGGKALAALLVPDKDEDADKGDGADLETLDALSRKMILAHGASNAKEYTDALRTFIEEVIASKPAPSADDGED